MRSARASRSRRRRVRRALSADGRHPAAAAHRVCDRPVPCSTRTAPCSVGSSRRGGPAGSCRGCSRSSPAERSSPVSPWSARASGRSTTKRRRADIPRRLVAASRPQRSPRRWRRRRCRTSSRPRREPRHGRRRRGGEVRTLKIPPTTATTGNGDPCRSRRRLPQPMPCARSVIELHGRERIRELYPPDVEQLLRRIVSVLVIPLPRQTGAVGVAFAETASRPRRARDARCDRRRAHPRSSARPCSSGSGTPACAPS